MIFICLFIVIVHIIFVNTDAVSCTLSLTIEKHTHFFLFSNYRIEEVKQRALEFKVSVLYYTIA